MIGAELFVPEKLSAKLRGPAACRGECHLGQRIERHPDGKKRRHFKLNPSPSEDLVRNGDGSDEDRKRPFQHKEKSNEADWYWIFDDDICAVRIAKHYLKLDGLMRLGQAVSSDVRELRNDVAHNEPTPALMDDARRRMVAASLWSEQDTFLTQPLVQEVLHELGERHPNALCNDLLRTIRDRLLAEPRRAVVPTAG